MIPEVHQAVAELRDFTERRRSGEAVVVERTQVVAFALVCAAVDHWPSRVQTDWHRLLTEADLIRQLEPGRVVKQRRIMISHIAAELERISEAALQLDY